MLFVSLLQRPTPAPSLLLLPLAAMLRTLLPRRMQLEPADQSNSLALRRALVLLQALLGD
jgi:hypothetical protein